MIRLAFRSRDVELLWTVFQVYVKPTVMFASTAWSPLLKYDITMLENVQQRFTKSLCGLRNLFYEQRLSSLNALSLEDSQNFAYIFICRCLNNLYDLSLAEIGLILSKKNERSGRLCLQQPHSLNNAASAIFTFRVPSMWNSLPSDVTAAANIYKCKNALFNYFIEKYTS